MALSAFRTAIWIPYPTANPGNGFWGEQTSTLNFCEEVSERVCGSFFFSFSLSVYQILTLKRTMHCRHTALSFAM